VAALVHQVDDELELVQTLEVGHLRGVARVDERLEADFHHLGDTATEDGLLAEEVRLDLLFERRLDDARPGAADGLCVGECAVLRVAGGVLVDRNQAGCPLAAVVGPAHEVAGRLRCDHRHVDALLGLYLAVVDVQPVGELQRVAGLQPVLDGLVDGRLDGVGDQHDDAVGLGGRYVGRLHGEAGRLGVRTRGRPFAEADDDVDTGVVEVQRVGVAL